MLVFSLMLVFLAIVAVVLFRAVSAVSSIGFFILAFIIVVYFFVPGSLAPYLGWIQDVIDYPIGLARTLYNNITQVLR